MIPFTSEAQRYEYPLTPESVVLDFGGYAGSFAKSIVEKYGCRVLVFEPVSKWYFECVKNLTAVPGVSIYMFGVGGESRFAEMGVSGDSTGLLSSSPEREMVQLRTLKDIMDGFELPAVDLVKLNVEGAEFETVEQAIKDGTIKRIKNLQVQVHRCVEDAEARWSAIQKRLEETHELTYYGAFCWENWQIKA